MTPEDSLRRLLHEHAATVEPRADGLSRIRQRIGRRRPWLAPAAAAAAAVLVVAVVAVLRPGTASAPPPTVTLPHPTASSAAQATSPASPAVPAAGTGTTTSASGLAVWPVTTDRQADAWRANQRTRPWGGDPAQVAARFASDFLQLPGLRAGGVQRSSGAAEVPLLSGARVVSRVRLVQVGGHPDSPWSVTGGTSPELVISRPDAETPVVRPLSVQGSAVGVDLSVRTTLISSSGRRLDLTTTAAGSARPWATTLSWQDTSWSVAAVVAVTFSAKDGSPSDLAVTAVARYEPASAATP